MGLVIDFEDRRKRKQVVEIMAKAKAKCDHFHRIRKDFPEAPPGSTIRKEAYAIKAEGDLLYEQAIELAITIKGPYEFFDDYCAFSRSY